MRVFNVGPGREALALHALGAKKVFHADISSVAVGSLKKYVQAHGLVDISTAQMDLCDEGALGDYLDGKIEFVYMSGILQHLRSPEMAFRNLNHFLGEGSYVFIRHYLTGAWKWLVVALLRQLIPYTTYECVEEVCCRKLGISADAAYETRFMQGLIDSAYVPNHDLYSPPCIDRYFEANGWKKVSQDNLRQGPHYFAKGYDHNTPGLGAEGISLMYQRVTCGHAMSGFPMPVDQLRDIEYSVELKDLIQQFEAVKNRVALSESPLLAAGAIVELYALGYAGWDACPPSSQEKYQVLRKIVESLLA
jgi:hypothetical protein